MILHYLDQRDQWWDHPMKGRDVEARRHARVIEACDRGRAIVVEPRTRRTASAR
ncbi:hypothetical protein [Capillimicrobium parvum]|uniref:Uncharacterized protein n=1 Tax=Capillimicrobium parvum TaxID=2884022 RepID=A0A9E6XUC3_9ACTN|nr:hypothetical protein [Capillimicrobium parvum]UGS34534.1 hypothetical protein DSM104329_00912 [Capillimicrobium parvum]